MSQANIILSQDPDSDEMLIRGHGHDLNEFKAIGASYDILEYIYIVRRKYSDEERQISLITAAGQFPVTWRIYQNEKEIRRGDTFIYDDVAARIYPFSSPSIPAGDKPMQRSVLLHLAHNRYPQMSASIADDLNEGQKNPAQAVRGAIVQIREISKDLIITTGQGYLLNPDIPWLVITEELV